MERRIRMKLDAGHISFDISELIEALTAEERNEVINTLACQEQVITEVANQIIDGYTSLGYHGGKGSAHVEAYSGLALASRRIAEAANDIAAREIEALKQSLRAAQEAQRNGWDAYHQLLAQRA